MGSRKPLLAMAAAAALTLTAAGCGSSGDGSARLALVAYSTPQAAYEKLIPRFRATSAGRGVSFTQSYGPSGEQSRAVDSGLPADVVAFSLAPDVTRLVRSGLVARDWDHGRGHGFVTDSVVVLAVRRGNPRHIRGWSDLLRPGIEVVTPNPFTSGGARWNLMAAYGAQLELGRSPAQALAYLRALLVKHVKVQDKSARDSLQTFASGKGDVLIAYENEAIAARRKGIPLQYVVPRQTILIQNPIAVVKTSTHAAQARAFVAWLHTPAAQRVFARQGYRPVVRSVARHARFPRPRQLFTISKVGGWDRVMKRFFDPDHGAVARIEQDAGVSVASG